jgi:hypothetical protein
MPPFQEVSFITCSASCFTSETLVPSSSAATSFAHPPTHASKSWSSSPPAVARAPLAPDDVRQHASAGRVLFLDYFVTPVCTAPNIPDMLLMYVAVRTTSGRRRLSCGCKHVQILSSCTGILTCLGLRDLGWQHMRGLKRDPSKNINTCRVGQRIGSWSSGPVARDRFLSS